MYDHYTRRWYIIADANGEAATSSLMIAVSQTNDPTGLWNEFIVLYDGTGTDWLDYPTVGYNKKWITIAGNPFGISSGSSTGAAVFVFNKALLLAGTSATYTRFNQASSFTICPAITYDSTQNVMYAMESWDGTAAQLKLWKIAGNVGSETMTAVGYPAGAAADKWQFESNMFSGTAGGDFAPQAGSANKIQTNDDRVYDLKFMNHMLWCSHNAFLPYSTTTNATRCSIQWWQVDTNANPIQLGYINDNTSSKFYFFPSLSVNTQNDVLIGFSTVSSTTYASSGYALHLHTDPNDSMRPPVVYRHGLDPYYVTFSGTKNRWGDYSQASVDPTNMYDFWTIQESASTPGSGYDRWDTWWAHIKICANPVVGVITGTNSLCTGASATLTDTTASGVWSSSASTVATVSPAGVVTALLTGTAVISYTATNVCGSTSMMDTITVITVPAIPAAITGGSASICAGVTTTFTDGTSGGVWSSVTPTVATVNTTGGITGLTAGTSLISYTKTNACGSAAATRTITINPLPATPGPIVGTPTVCTGFTTALSDTPLLGTWSSVTTSVATVNSSGVVTGVLAGTSLISYTISNGCGSHSVSTTVTVSTGPGAPAAITGTTTVCTGAMTTLFDATGTGVWSSVSTGVATINATGVVTGVTTGTSLISYTVTNACGVSAATTTVTVNTVPSVAGITGTLSVCDGSQVTLSDATGTGTWSSVSTGVATINAAGTVTGVTAGTSLISYAVTNGCGMSASTATVTVDALPAVSPITGVMSTCTSGTSTLSDATGSGVWTSSNTSVATVSTTGVVTGVTAGTTNISYTVTNGSGCVTAVGTIFTVNPGGPVSIITPAGATTFCSGSSVVLNGSTGGGYTYQWQIGGVNITGATTSSYTASIGGTYDLVITNGACSTTSSGVTVTVNTTPIVPAIGGPSSVCIGQSISLTDGMAGGTWTSASTGTATVNTAGVVSGVTAGSVAISYTVINACGTTNVLKTVTVHSLPAVSAITGTMGTCAGGSATLTDATTGGVWTSGTTSIATVTAATGDVTGVAAGTALISYTYTDGFGCASTTTTTFIVNTGTTASITAAGTTTFCAGGSVVLNANTGTSLTYQWQHNGTNITGATSSSYTASLGGTYVVIVHSGSCSATSSPVTVTISATVVGAITASVSAVCPGSQITLSDTTAGGVWTTASSSVATVSTSGIVTGISAGTVNISYTASGICGAASQTLSITVYSAPVVAAITGTTGVCLAGTTTLADATPSGVWSSSNAAIATVSATGVVTGTGVGTASIFYSVTNGSGCSASAASVVTVNALPAASITATGPTSFCSGGYVVLDAPTGAGLTYQWRIGGTNIPGATASAYTASISGSFTVVITSGSGCPAISAPVVVTVSGSIAVTPLVAVTAVPGTIICTTGSTVTYTATPVNGGATPVYNWSVNGVAAGTGAGYSYAPANGDVVRCLLTSNATCAFPDTAFNSATMIVSSAVDPLVSISVTPNDTVCVGTYTTFAANPIYGGTAPSYVWRKNSTPVSTSPVYSYVPANGDILKVTLTSNFPCRLSDTAVSSPLTMTVDPVSVNTVTINGHASIISGQADTFTAYAPHGGSSPAYQWYINGVPVPGATNASYITTTLTNSEIVTCQVISSDPCALPNSITSSGITVMVSTGVAETTIAGAAFTLIPNPNAGTFMIKGSLGQNLNEQVNVKITNMIGQSVYTSVLPVHNGAVNEQIVLDHSVSAGMYLVNIITKDGSVVFHMVVNK